MESIIRLPIRRKAARASDECHLRVARGGDGTLTVLGGMPCHGMELALDAALR